MNHTLTNFLTNFVTFCSYKLSYEKFYEFRPSAVAWIDECNCCVDTVIMYRPML